ncbi:MAG: metallophosphoesterase [Elusimicrobia bacterium]|nr:metallophosphoesterase [Elusimicrobiota bacterium]
MDYAPLAAAADLLWENPLVSEPARRAESQARLLCDLAAPWRTRRQLERLESPSRSQAETFRFGVLGDAEPGRFWLFRKLFNRPGVFESHVRRIQGDGCDFTMQLGDMVSCGTPENYVSFFEDLSAWGVETPYLTTIGNHDRRYPHGVTDSDTYRSCFGPVNYAFDRGGWRFVSVDSSAHRVTGPQLRWLDRVLDTTLRTVVFTHIPPAVLREWPHYRGARGVGGFRRGAEEFTDILSRRRVERVYLGHIHAFGVQDFKGVRYVLTGGGGSPLFPCGVEDRFHHYLVVEAGPDGLRETIRSADGRDLAIPRAAVVLSRA